jgi:hypothetical protein
METTNWATQGARPGHRQRAGRRHAPAQCLRYRNGSQRAGLVWLGTLLYLVYAYVVYAMAVHFNPAVPGLRGGPRVELVRGHVCVVPPTGC